MMDWELCFYCLGTSVLLGWLQSFYCVPQYNTQSHKGAECLSKCPSVNQSINSHASCNSEDSKSSILVAIDSLVLTNLSRPPLTKSKLASLSQWLVANSTEYVNYIKKNSVFSISVLWLLIIISYISIIYIKEAQLRFFLLGICFIPLI